MSGRHHENENGKSKSNFVLGRIKNGEEIPFEFFFPSRVFGNCEGGKKVFVSPKPFPPQKSFFLRFLGCRVAYYPPPKTQSKKERKSGLSVLPARPLKRVKEKEKESGASCIFFVPQEFEGNCLRGGGEYKQSRRDKLQCWQMRRTYRKKGKLR